MLLHDVFRKHSDTEWLNSTRIHCQHTDIVLARDRELVMSRDEQGKAKEAQSWDSLYLPAPAELERAG